jgi:hypothetical protein
MTLNVPEHNDRVKTIFTRRQLVLWGLFSVVTVPFALKFIFLNRKENSSKLSNLTSTEARVFEMIYRVISGDENKANLDYSSKFLSNFKNNLTKRNRFELKLVLYLVEFTPIIFNRIFSSFSHATYKQQQAILLGWEQGISIRFAIFQSVKELTFMVYYSIDQHLEKIGYQVPSSIEYDEDFYNKSYFDLGANL